MDTQSNGSEPAVKPRNDRGQWVAGVSGNRSGRPRKKRPLPKSLTEHLADAMTDNVPLIDCAGNREMVPAYEAIARQLVRSLPTLKPREMIAVMKWMDQLRVFDEMSRQAGNRPEELNLEEIKERIRSKLKEIRATSWLGNHALAEAAAEAGVGNSGT